jgi:hypothetical protein
MTLREKQKCPDGQHIMEGLYCSECGEFVNPLAASRNCEHGVRLFGANPPPCVQCELAWCEMMLPVKKAAYEKAKAELEDVRRRAAAVTNHA